MIFHIFPNPLNSAKLVDLPPANVPTTIKREQSCDSSDPHNADSRHFPHCKRTTTTQCPCCWRITRSACSQPVHQPVPGLSSSGHYRTMKHTEVPAHPHHSLVKANCCLAHESRWPWLKQPVTGRALCYEQTYSQSHRKAPYGKFILSISLTTVNTLTCMSLGSD